MRVDNKMLYVFFVPDMPFTEDVIIYHECGKEEHLLPFQLKHLFHLMDAAG